MSAATPSAATAAIVLENVSCTYPGAERPVLRGVFLEIPRGQCVVVTGASGCGKTTLTRLINGLVPHVYAVEVKGRVMVEGTEVAAWTPDELGVRVGSVFQNPRSQFVNLDVASEIAFGCENLGLPRGEIVARVSKAARALGIADLLDRGIEELSGGQITVELYLNGTLGDEKQSMQGIQMGTLDIFRGNASSLSNYGAEKISLTGLPFLFKDMDQFEAMAQSSLGQELLDSVDEADCGYVALGTETHVHHPAHLREAGQAHRVHLRHDERT